jgi:hypothetical protein
MKTKITIKTKDGEKDVEIDLDELLLKAQKRELNDDDMQNLFNYLIKK